MNVIFSLFNLESQLISLLPQTLLHVILHLLILLLHFNRCFVDPVFTLSDHFKCFMNEFLILLSHITQCNLLVSDCPVAFIHSHLVPFELI